MTAEEISEGNKLIAEFMGATKWTHKKDGIIFHLPGSLPSYTMSELKYHSEWDWLMPVVEKITNMGWQFQLNSYKTSNDAKFLYGENTIQNIAWSTPLLATYNLVIDFIKWYNTQHPKQ